MTLRTNGGRFAKGMRAAAAATVLAAAMVSTSGGATPVASASNSQSIVVDHVPARSTTPSPATGQITAHDAKFWLGSNPVTLRGFNMTPGPTTGPESQQAASWGANFARLTVHWFYLEPNPPVHNADGTWTHSYDPTYLGQIISTIQSNAQNGIYSMIGNNACSSDDDCAYFDWPSWLYQSAYNSHHTTYPQTTQGIMQSDTDLWSDPLRQQFQGDELSWLASRLKGLTGVVGYLVLNEPNQGALPSTHATTQLMLDTMLTWAKGIRAQDPTRVIAFGTRHGNDWGLANADLSGWANLTGQPNGNVALDLHDYFGARWGDGMLENPTSSRYGEVAEPIYMHVDEDQGPFQGTVLCHVRFVQHAQAVLAKWGGIPLFIGEWGDDVYDEGIYGFYGTTANALDMLGVPWIGWYGGHLGITTGTGTLEPWGYLLIQAL